MVPSLFEVFIFRNIFVIRIFTKLPTLSSDLLWADPESDIQGWGENDRGVSYVFGAKVINKFLKTHDLDLICRAHQVVEEGYEFFGGKRFVPDLQLKRYKNYQHEYIHVHRNVR